MSGQFWADRRGNFATITALLAIVLILLVGAAIDLARQHNASVHIQALADAAALKMAIAPEQEFDALRQIGDQSLATNLSRRTLPAVNVERLDTSREQIDLQLSGSIQTVFMGIAGYETMDVNARAIAKREIRGTVEVALVLDNTYSMIGPGTSGEKIASLKAAASLLVNKLMTDESEAVRIGLVPYADYVNVGISNQNASWLRIETQDQPRPRTCRMEYTSSTCVSRNPSYSCRRYKDGIPYNSTCGGECTNWQEHTLDEPREVCDGGNIVEKHWFGCVGSRTGADNRLHDRQPSVPYPGLIDDIIKCPTPIVPLTTKKRALLDGIEGMVVQRPHYEPLTYIPAGLIWGQNILSPSEPFTEAAAYDADKRNPRKIMILMTDGDNTMMFHPSNGRHGQMRGGNRGDNDLSADDLRVRRRERDETNGASKAICDHVKSHNTEIYTVSFMVETDAGRDLMRKCASSEAHYFDANDRQQLVAAFEGIANSISRVRIAR